MGAGLAKNKLSPEPSKRGTPRGVISVAPPPTPVTQSKQHDQGPEDDFLEKVANQYMKRDRKSFHQGTTYAGVDLRLEVDCVDNPAEVWISSRASYTITQNHDDIFYLEINIEIFSLHFYVDMHDNLSLGTSS